MSFDAALARNAGPNLGWDRLSLAEFAVRFVDAGGAVAEIDSLTGCGMGLGRGGLPRRHFVFPPFDYVRAILVAGLEVEGESAARIAAAGVAGGADFDYAPIVGAFDPQYNDHVKRRLRVRTLDRLLENLPQPRLLLFGGRGVRADILRGGRASFAACAPVVVARPESYEDFSAFAAALCEIEPAYEWVQPANGRIDPASVRPYHVAVAAAEGARGDAGRAFARLAREGTGEALTAPAPGLAALRAKPDAFVASRGFYATERHGDCVWRWGGRLPRLSVLLEAPTPGLYEIRIAFANAVEGVTRIKVNGTPRADVERRGTDTFVLVARVVRPLLLEIDCPARRTIPPDSRRLSLSLAEITLSQLAA